MGSDHKSRGLRAFPGDGVPPFPPGPNKKTSALTMEKKSKKRKNSFFFKIISPCKQKIVFQDIFSNMSLKKK